MSIQHYYSQTIADGTATSVVRPSDWNSAHKQVLNMAGNTAGTSQITGSDIIWAGGNNVTLSANGSTVSVIGPTQSVQTQVSGNIAGIGFTTTTVAGAVVAATHDGAGLLMAVPNYLTTAQPVGAYLTTAAQSDHSHGNPTLALTNLSGTTASASNGFTISLSAANPGGGAGDGYNIIGVNGGATQLSTTYQLSNANNVTFGLNAGTITASASYAAQTVQTQASGNIAGSGYTSTTQAGTAIGATLNSNGLSLAQPAFLTTAQPVGAYLTTARASNDAIGLNTALTANGVSVTANSSGLSINVPAFLTTAAQSNHSHNFATTTTNGAVIVVGTTNSAGATIGVPSFLTTAALSQNTSNYAGIGTTFAGTNATATLAANTNGVALSLSVAGGGVINQTGPNIAVAGSTVTSGDVYFSNSPTVTFGMAGSTITASAAGGGAGVTISQFPQFPLAYSSSSVVSGTSGAGSTSAAMYITPMIILNDLHFQEVEMLMSHGALSAGTGSATVGWHLGIYTLNGGTALSLVSSFSAAARISQNSATAQTIQTYWGSTSNANSTQTSGNISAAYMTAGLRDIKLIDNASGTLTAGTYYLAQCVTMRSSSVNVANSFMTGMYAPGITNHGYLGQSTLGPGIGRLNGSATSQITGAAGNTLSMSMPVSINTTAITMSASNAARWVQPRFYV